MAYYQDIITTKSFKILQSLSREYDFILIGGWAVFLYTHSLKSKDIDIVIAYDELEKIRTKYELIKNDRLKKYEISQEEIDVDIYLPHYSKIGIALEDLQNYSQNIEGFRVPKKEMLLILKQVAYHERQGSIKGEKDKLDIISLLSSENFDYGFYKKILKKYKLDNFLEELKNLVNSISELPELALNQYKYAKFKNFFFELCLEKYQSFPRGIKWAEKKGKIYITQSRPITTLQ